MFALPGRADVGVTPYSLAGFGNLRALSRRNESPATALRPFDADRDGMVLGEGGAIFVLERAQDARAAGRDAYAEIAARRGQPATPIIWSLPAPIPPRRSPPCAKGWPPRG